MKTTHITTTLLAFLLTLGFSATQAFSAPIDPKGIPADAAGILHIDFAVAAKSAIVQATQQLAKNQTKDSARDLDKWQKLTGIDPEKDIHGLTLGFLKPADSDASEPSVVAIIRGSFSPDKITAAARELKATVSTRGSLTLITVNPALLDGSGGDSDRPGRGKKRGNRNSNDDNDDDDDDDNPFARSSRDKKPQIMHAAIVDKSTVLFAQSEDAIDKVAATFSGKAKSYEIPSALANYGKQEGSPMLIGCVSGDLIQGQQAAMMGMSAPKSILYSVGEKSSNLRARILMEFASAKDATQTHQMLQSILGMVPMMMAGQQSPDSAAKMQDLQRVLNSLKLTAKDANLDILFEHPAADLVKMMRQ